MGTCVCVLTYGMYNYVSIKYTYIYTYTYVCVESPESKGTSRGATAHLRMLPNEAMEVVEGFMDA